jgi:hypothetical protein
MTELKLWHQQPGESSKAFAAFCAYKNLDPSERSISTVVSDLGKSRSTIGGWSSTWNWVERVEEWDQEEDRRLSLSRIEQKRKMDEEHLRIARAARNKAVRALAEVDPSDFTPKDVLSWLDTCLRLERLIVGEPETIEKHRAKIEQRRVRAAAQDYDIEKEMEELAPIIEDMYRRGILSDPWDGEEEEEGQPS